MSERACLVSRHLRFSVSAAAILAAIGTAGTVQLAHAQSEASSNQLQTIVVTAEKRSENVQKVPIAITAFTSSELQNKGIGDLNQLSNLTPNVNLDGGSPFSGDNSVLSASIRGIGQDDFAFNTEPGVGVYLDGVYLARTIGANVDLLDVQRIEVLKGPQGTLFGRNTIGGAISIVTRDPASTFGWKAEATTGSRNRRDIAASVDVPITDKLLSTWTFSSVERDGYQKVIPFPNPGNYSFDPVSPINGGTTSYNTLGGQNRQAVRGKLVWDASDNVKVEIIADWTHQDQPAIANTVLQTFPNTPGAAGSIAALYNACLDGSAALFLPPNGYHALCELPRNGGTLPPLAGSNLLPVSPSAEQTGNIDTTYANGPNFAKYDVEGFNGTVTWSVADNLTLKSITGYRHILWNIGTDLDGSANHGEWQSVTDKQRQQQVSEELQAVGNTLNDRLNYVFGLYFFYEDGFVHDWVPFDGSLLSVEDSGLNDLKTSSYAAYIHADYKITDKLGIAVGARYSIDHKQFLGGQQDLNGLAYKASGCYPPNGSANALLDPTIPVGVTCQQALGFPVAGQPYRYFPDGWNTRNFYEFTPTASLQYQFTDNFMAYVSWSKGFKSGGWTTRLSAPIATGDLAEYGPEKAKTTEGGFKSQWFNHRLQINGAGFYTDYTGIQLNQQIGASPVLKNLGDADIFGGELETVAALSDGFTIASNLAYLHAEYTHLDPSVGTSVTLSSKLPKTPEWKYTLNPKYEIDLNNGRAIQFQAVYTYVSSLYNDSLNTPLLKRPALDLLDASVSFSFNDGQYVITAGGANMTDRRYITTGSVNYAGGQVDGTYNAPAEWYLRLRARM